jgi:hypothetical protein
MPTPIDPIGTKLRYWAWTSPGIVGGKLMMPADLQRLHKYMLDIEGVDAISDEMRAVVEELWPGLVHKLPPKQPAQGWWHSRLCLTLAAG